MNLEDQIRDALVTELERQAEEGGMNFEPAGDGESGRLAGTLDLRSLAMAVAGSLAGGP